MMRKGFKGYKGISIWTSYLDIFGIQCNLQPVHILQITTGIFQSCQEVHHIVSNLLFIKRFNATQVIHAFSMLPGTKKACEWGSH